MPEILVYSVGDRYGIAADIWSLGVIMFLVLRGKLPFDGYNRVRVLLEQISCA